MRGLTQRLTLVAVASTGAMALGSAAVAPADSSARAHAVTGTAAQPYGGCAEGWQAPRSPGADLCRRLGYTVSARFVVGARGVVLHSSLPHCTYEDGSGGPRPCTWNIGRRIDGNGVGLAYKVRRDMSARYVWAKRPPRDEWRWVGERQAHRLARQFTQPAQRRSLTAWQRCVVRLGGTALVRCPDGRRYRP